jgi:hypothetical protein
LKIPLDASEIVFSVHPYGVVRGLGDRDWYAMLQKTELLELLGLL